MKKRIFLLVALLVSLSAMALSSCKKVNISVSSTEVTVGEKIKLEASSNKVSWSSSDESVLKVNGNEAEALKAGQATITAKSGNKSEYSVVINVKEKSQEGNSGNDGSGSGDQNQEKDAYTVSFDSKGGTAVKSEEVAKGAKAKQPVDPIYVSAGKISEFLGWYVAGTDQEYDFSQAVNADLSLEAKWSSEAYPLAGGTEGKLYNFKYADAAYRELLCATLERWLIDKGISIPLYYSNGLVMYNERITTAVDEYVAGMGYGATYGSFTGEDNYRTATTAMADTANKFDYRSDSDSGVIGSIEASLYTLDWNENFSGFEALPELASGFPVAVTKNENGEWVESETTPNDSPAYEELSRSWKVYVRTDMKFADGDPITLQNFEDNLAILLDPTHKYYRANACYSGSFVIVNAKKYYDGECEWENVGFEFDYENNCIIYTLTQKLSQIDFMYNTSSFLFGVADKEFHDALGKEGFGAIPQGTTEFTSVKASGEFIVEYYEDEKEVRYVRNPEYVKNELRYHQSVFSKFTETKVESAEAAWELFKQGELDAASVPSAEYANYVSDPRAKTSPGATVWRLSVNQLSDEAMKEFTGGAWDGNALMQNRDFQWALYFGVNREHLAKNIVVAADPCQYYVNNTYKVAVQAVTGYRDSEAAGKVAGLELTSTNINLLEESYGYSEDDARNFYVKALDALVAEGKVDPNVETTLAVEINNWPATSTVQVNVTNYLKSEYERIFNGQTKYPNIHFEVEVAMTDSSTSYYSKQMVGKYDLGMAGISGGSLDILGLFDVWSSSDLNGLRLSMGVNTEEIVKLEDLILWDGEYWTYDALVAAASAPVWVAEGVKNEAYADAVADVETKVEALKDYTLSELGLEDSLAALLAFVEGYDAYLAELQAALEEAKAAYAEEPTEELEATIAELEAAIEEAAADYEAAPAQIEALQAALEQWETLVSNVNDQLTEVLTPADAYAILDEFVKTVENALELEEPFTDEELTSIYGNAAYYSVFDWLNVYEDEDILVWLLENGYGSSYGKQVLALFEQAADAIVGWQNGVSEESYKAICDANNALASWYSSTWA